MRALTKKQQEWLWFAALWCGGLLGTGLLAFLVRTLFR
ncbi:MAG: DUF2474 domain-containing protein [Syntrophobacteraceae bacterium]